MMGWIKLYRKLLDSPIFSNEKGLKVWIWCLLKANHKEKDDFLMNRQPIVLGPGQFIFGRYIAAEELRMPPSTVWFWIQSLMSRDYVDIKTTNKFSIITIKKWREYQIMLTTDEQEKNTYNNVNNVNNLMQIKDLHKNLNQLINWEEVLLSLGMDKKVAKKIASNDMFWEEKGKMLYKKLFGEEIENKAGYIVSVYQFWKDEELPQAQRLYKRKDP